MVQAQASSKRQPPARKWRSTPDLSGLRPPRQLRCRAAQQWAASTPAPRHRCRSRSCARMAVACLRTVCTVSRGRAPGRAPAASTSRRVVLATAERRVGSLNRRVKCGRVTRPCRRGAHDRTLPIFPYLNIKIKYELELKIVCDTESRHAACICLTTIMDNHATGFSQAAALRISSWPPPSPPRPVTSPRPRPSF